MTSAQGQIHQYKHSGETDSSEHTSSFTLFFYLRETPTEAGALLVVNTMAPWRGICSRPEHGCWLSAAPEGSKTARRQLAKLRRPRAQSLHWGCLPSTRIPVFLGLQQC